MHRNLMKILSLLGLSQIPAPAQLAGRRWEIWGRPGLLRRTLRQVQK